MIKTHNFHKFNGKSGENGEDGGNIEIFSPLSLLFPLVKFLLKIDDENGDDTLQILSCSRLGNFV